jgi:hypothetical protein
MIGSSFFDGNSLFGIGRIIEKAEGSSLLD